MPFTQEQIDEMEILIRFNPASSMEGIKVHKTAKPELIEAVKRLHEKKMVTQIDGGYLTDLGREAAEMAQTLLTMLAKPEVLAH